jgi:hypothetical protein
MNRSHKPTKITLEKTVTHYLLVQSSPQRRMIVRKESVKENSNNAVALFHMRRHGMRLAEHFAVPFEDATI